MYVNIMEVNIMLTFSRSEFNLSIYSELRMLHASMRSGSAPELRH